MEETDFKLRDLKVQLGQFSITVDLNASIRKIIEIPSYLRKNHGQKLLIPKVFKLAKLVLKIPATNTGVIIFYNETLLNPFQ